MNSKKTLPDALETARSQVSKVEVWSQDEHRVGLKPVLRRMLAPVSQRPTVTVNPRYEWLWLVAFVEPFTGRNIWFLMPFLTAEVFQIAVDCFADELKIPEDTRVILVLDQAPWHLAKKIVAPARVELLFLPAYSPELQPAEHLWALSDEVFFNQNFADLDAMELVLAAQCVKLEADLERVKGATLFGWWEEVIVSSMN